MSSPRPTPSTHSRCHSSRSTSNFGGLRRDARARLRRSRHASGRRGDHARRARPERGTGAGRGLRRLPYRPARRRDRRLGHAVPDSARPRRRRCRRGGRPGGDDGHAGRPRRDRLARTVRRQLSGVPAGRSASLLEQPARGPAHAPRVRRRGAEPGAALRHVRRPRDRSRGLRRGRARGAAGRPGVPDRVRILHRRRRRPVGDTGSAPARRSP